MAQTVGIGLAAGAVSTVVAQPLEFLKTKIQVINEGIGVRGVRLNMGYNMFRVFTDLHEAGHGSRVLWTG